MAHVKPSRSSSARRAPAPKASSLNRNAKPTPKQPPALEAREPPKGKEQAPAQFFWFDDPQPQSTAAPAAPQVQAKGSFPWLDAMVGKPPASQLQPNQPSQPSPPQPPQPLPQATEQASSPAATSPTAGNAVLTRGQFRFKDEEEQQRIREKHQKQLQQRQELEAQMAARQLQKEQEKTRRAERPQPPPTQLPTAQVVSVQQPPEKPTVAVAPAPIVYQSSERALAAPNIEKPADQRKQGDFFRFEGEESKTELALKRRRQQEEQRLLLDQQLQEKKAQEAAKKHTEQLSGKQKSEHLLQPVTQEAPAQNPPPPSAAVVVTPVQPLGHVEAAMQFVPLVETGTDPIEPPEPNQQHRTVRKYEASPDADNTANTPRKQLRQRGKEHKEERAPPEHVKPQIAKDPRKAKKEEHEKKLAMARFAGEQERAAAKQRREEAEEQRKQALQAALEEKERQRQLAAEKRRETEEAERRRTEQAAQKKMKSPEESKPVVPSGARTHREGDGGRTTKRDAPPRRSRSEDASSPVVPPGSRPRALPPLQRSDPVSTGKELGSPPKRLRSPTHDKFGRPYSAPLALEPLAASANRSSPPLVLPASDAWREKELHSTSVFVYALDHAVPINNEQPGRARAPRAVPPKPNPFDDTPVGRH
eukprot:TRINITY_DN25605_c0_g1_i1.p1 TRINITY_DN25605_c0_g1~~TRINITY_DN25605_c0_g1_i1.p1  ORF type:complete len:647 (+),score=124.99 TRINITY_DN25605_c0_g1_i1:32-1972(+)